MTWQDIDWGNPLNAWFIAITEVLPNLKCNSAARLMFSLRCHGLVHEAFGDFIHESIEMPEGV